MRMITLFRFHLTGSGLVEKKLRHLRIRIPLTMLCVIHLPSLMYTVSAHPTEMVSIREWVEQALMVSIPDR